MGLSLATLARRAPAPVFPVCGGGARRLVQDLHLDPRVEVVDSPRHAFILLVIGRFPPGEVRGLAEVHDVVPTPRATLLWNGAPSPGGGLGSEGTGGVDELAEALVGLYRDLLSGELASEPPIRPDVDPVEWRGVGPYGQGGKGMTGGTPYGRPMADRGPDRDGLELDVVPITIGPWTSVLPSGMQVQVKLAGDVIQELRVLDPPVAGGEEDVFRRALREPVPIAELEWARVRHHLRWLAELLRLFDLPVLGRRVLQTAHSDDPAQIHRILRSVGRTGMGRLGLAGVGVTEPGSVSGLGPAARAAGLVEDARSDEPAYVELGFRPVTHGRGDAAARLRQRLAEISQSLDLAARAGERVAFGRGVVEGPRGRITLDGPSPSTVMARLFEDLLPGLEWGDAVMVIHSFDFDPAELAEDLEEAVTP